MGRQDALQKEEIVQKDRIIAQTYKGNGEQAQQDSFHEGALMKLHDDISNIKAECKRERHNHEPEEQKTPHEMGTVEAINVDLKAKYDSVLAEQAQPSRGAAEDYRKLTAERDCYREETKVLNMQKNFSEQERITLRSELDCANKE